MKFSKFKIIMLCVSYILFLIACGGGGGGDSSSSSSSSGGSTSGTVVFLNNSSVDIGYAYIRTTGSSSWGTDLTNTGSGVKIAPGGSLRVTGVSCNTNIDLRAEDYSGNYWQRLSYYLSCGSTLNWSLVDGGGSSSSSSSSSSSGGSSPQVTLYTTNSNAGGTIYIYWDTALKGTLTNYYVSGAPTCGSSITGSTVTFATTTGSHTFKATSPNYTWGPTTYNITSSCSLFVLQ